jgi:transposase-like protein/ribosomal protein L37AE/L43A
MEDYPKDLQEFDARFGTETACRNYLMKLRWPEGFVCPHCEAKKAWAVREILWQCAQCGRQTSVTAGTIFQDTRTSLRVWFQAMWWLTTQKNGASALGLQRVLGLKHYQTAWTWLHKLRTAMVRPGRDLLTGTIEMDEAYLGGLEEGAPGRGTQRKALIGVAAQEDGRGIGRIRLQRLADASAQSLEGFICASIAPGSVLHTDGWQGYAGVTKRGYAHKVTVVKGKPADELLPRTHRVISLLKRWLRGTHQGAVGHKHLDYYLDEFTFRFNRRASTSRGKLFYRLAQQAMLVEPRTYRMIVDQTAPAAPKHKG